MKVKQVRRWQKQSGAVLIGLIIVLGAWMILGAAPEGTLKAGLGAALRSPGGPRLISVQPLPEAADGEMCQWLPASASTSLMTELQQEQGKPQDDIGTREPIRKIKDSYSSYSSVAVDTANDEVVMTDESLFNILTYSRTENTPASATMSEPKRMIGGVNSWVEYQCGVYIDPVTGDIYAVNNDTVDKLVIFSRKKQGNAAPDRIVNTPHTTYGIAVDEPHHELFLTAQESASVVVFDKYAKTDDSPLRLLQGDKTLLADPHGLAVDSKRDLMFVTNFGNAAKHDASTAPRRGGGGGDEGGFFSLSPKENWPLARESAVPGSGQFTGPSITVYKRDAEGDVAPLRVIRGPKAGLNWPTGLSVDSERGELYVANDTGDDILVFSTDAAGDAAPKRVIKGPKSLVKSPTGVFFDSKHQELWVSNFGNHTATVYKASASGDSAPLRVIRSAPLSMPTPNIGNAYAPAYDSKRDQILVPD